MRTRRCAAAAIGALMLVGGTAKAELGGSWPAEGELGRAAGVAIAFPSSSPFTPADAADAPPVEGTGRLFLPEGATAATPAPAVVLLHGAGGVREARELTYARQYAAMGVAALVVDAFAARRENGATAFVDRLLNITESMLVADAYAALRWLTARDDIDADRIALVGFSYGGMASLYAAHAQMAEVFAPRGGRFAAHVAYYAPCIARFERRDTTGAPILMMMGGADEITDPERCAETAADLRAGGSEVETRTFPGAVHQWDGGFGRWRARYNLAACSLTVDSEGAVSDGRTYLPMTGPLSRKIILALCVDDGGYLIGRDEAVRARSNAEVGRFLARVLTPPKQG